MENVTIKCKGLRMLDIPKEAQWMLDVEVGTKIEWVPRSELYIPEDIEDTCVGEIGEIPVTLADIFCLRVGGGMDYRRFLIKEAEDAGKEGVDPFEILQFPTYVSKKLYSESVEWDDNDSTKVYGVNQTLQLKVVVRRT